MRKHERKFLEFHHANPTVEEELVKMSDILRNKGITRYSISGLFAVLRYQYDIRPNAIPGDSFKLNNNYQSYYARMLMRKYPRLQGFFVIRERSPHVNFD